MDSVNILCLKWGTRYPAEFTNILHRSVRRHLHRPFRFVCVTDNASGLDPEIDTVPIPENPFPDRFAKWPNIYMKLAIFRPGFADLRGPTLFSDVDVVIQRDLDGFFDYEPGANCIIHNWVESRKLIFRKRPAVGNSSLFRYNAGECDYVYETFLREVDDALDPQKYPTEQAFLTHAFRNVRWWPEEWVKSFKRTCVPAFPLNLFVRPRKPDTRVLVFHGKPDPDQAVAGYSTGKLEHRVKPCPWILEDWHL